MYPNDNEPIQTIYAKGGPYIDEEIKATEHQYVGTNLEWATPEKAFNNAIEYMHKTVSTNECHYYEGSVVLMIWKEKLSLFHEILEKHLTVNVNENTSISESYFSNIGIILNTYGENYFEDLNAGNSFKKATEFMKATITLGFTNLIQGERVYSILKDYQEKYEFILKNCIYMYIYHNILLPSYGITYTRKEWDLPMEELNFIQRQKYNFFKRISIKQDIPKKVTSNLEAFIYLWSNLPKTDDVEEFKAHIINLKPDFHIEEVQNMSSFLMTKIEDLSSEIDKGNIGEEKTKEELVEKLNSEKDTLVFNEQDYENNPHDSGI